MEGFGKPSLPPPPPPPPSSGRNNENEETENKTDNTSVKIPNPQEVSRARVPDPDHEKKLKRILAAREYSKRYHDKQHQRIENLENEAKVKEVLSVINISEIAVTSPRVRYTRRTNMLLRAENENLQHRLAVCTGKLMMKEAEYRELLMKRDLLQKNLHDQQMKMQQAGAAALNPPVEPGNMVFNPPAPPAQQLGCQVFGSNFGPGYQPFNTLPGLDSATVDFGQFRAPAAAAQSNIGQPAGQDDQIRSAVPNRLSNEPVQFSEFTNELSLVMRPPIMPNQDADQVGQGDEMSLDNSDDSKKTAVPSSFQFM